MTSSSVEIREEPLSELPNHSRVPIAFQVGRVFDVEIRRNGLGGFVLSERELAHPYAKDNDAIHGEGPTDWPKRFDISNWGLIAAYRDARRVGGAVVAFDTPNVFMLEARRDLAALWDLRVHPDLRGEGIGSRLLRASEQWATARGCLQLKIETQNNNVVACKFYESQGYVLGAINRYAYPELPDEVQLLWYKPLSG
ncbi:MAG: GNAT family N-acetyltransferase [Actinomycetota bacterium]